MCLTKKLQTLSLKNHNVKGKGDVTDAKLNVNDSQNQGLSYSRSVSCPSMTSFDIGDSDDKTGNCACRHVVFVVLVAVSVCVVGVFGLNMAEVVYLNSKRQ